MGGSGRGVGGAGDSLVFPWDMSRNRITLFEYR